MGRYEDLTLTVGVFFKDGTEHTNQVRFKGRLLANGEEVSFATREGAVRETEWEIYQTDDGKCLQWLKEKRITIRGYEDTKEEEE